MDSFSLTSSVAALPGIGPTRQEQLGLLEITTFKDLLYYAPFRYEEIDRPVGIGQLQVGTKATFKAKVESVLPIRSQRFRSMLKAKLSDETGAKLEVTWFNTPYVLAALKVGQEYYFTGKVAEYKNKLAITNPIFETSRPNVGALVPIYHETAKLTSRWLRKVIGQVLDLADQNQVYEQITSKNYEARALELNFVSLQQALRSLHQPASEEYLELAKKRLGYDEMLALVTGVMASKERFQQAKPVASLTVTNKDIAQFTKLLPYLPTESQKAALQSIALDLAQPHPMHRLLQGEVGAGKTTVAAFALWVAAKNSHQVALVCPTKILAEQHFQSLTELLPSTGVKVSLLTAKNKGTDQVATEAQIIIGTHALFHWNAFKPALVVIDEEHRFGVEQRKHFFQHAKKPHFLSMTATPIPRTVALTALADYDVSVLEPHRAANTVKTWVVPEQKRSEAYSWVKRHIEQAFVVCPFIDTSAIETLSSVKSASDEYQKLQKVFPEQNLTLLHGRMGEEDKTKVFSQMMSGEVDVLVTTPVVEVGVDIPRANIIIIEGAERFGLAQLHQLRGRVGRKGQPAFCMLFTSEDLGDVEAVSKRLQYFSQHYDGTALAEFDLKRRGSGELLGTRQHGFGTLQFASWFDAELIELCRGEVENNSF